MKNKRFSVALLVLTLLLLTLSHCKKQAYFASGDAEITLTATDLNIGLNESITIAVTGYNGDGSQLWDGTRIDLTVENGSLSSLFVELKDGFASFTATGNMERGEMKITARSGSVTAAPNPLVVHVGEIPEVGRITASLNPVLLPYTGGRVEIVATVYDADLVPIPDIAVVFESSVGTLVSRGASLISDQNGRVIDYLDTVDNALITIYAGSQSHTVDVVLDEKPDANNPPVAEFTFSPTNPLTKELIYFNAGGSTDSDGTVRSYVWDFGDGLYETGVRPYHKYDIGELPERTFTVMLIVYDDDGAYGSIAKTITVMNK